VHASIFFVLTILWLVYFLTANKLSPIISATIILFCISYGGLLEIMQSNLFKQRSGDWLDFIANSFGCLVGWLFFYKKKISFFRMK
jgi:VanZ family protein